MSWFKSTKWGLRLAAVWLIAMGIMGLIPALAIPGIGQILAILAVAAGVLILLDR
jgi:hypothetical protein